MPGRWSPWSATTAPASRRWSRPSPGSTTSITGTIRFDGETVTIHRPQDATALGIATVYQDLALCDNLDVVANLFLGREEISHGVGQATLQLDEATMEHRAGELFSGLAVTIPSLRSEVGTLSGGQRQQVAVARSLLGEPKVVLLDEPTAALGVPQTRQVLDLIRRLRERDLGVVVISHNLANVFDVADRIVVLRLGKVAGDFSADANHRGACRLRDHRRRGERWRESCRGGRGAGRAD